MRSLFLAALTLTLWPTTQTPTLRLATDTFSPRVTTLGIDAAPSSAGVEIVTASGRRVGWIAAPGARREPRLAWNGRFGRHAVPDGRFLVRLVVHDRVVSTSALEVDRRAPELERLRIDNGGFPFGGDNPMLTTVTPNGDGLRDRAIVRFNLSEPATVTLEATRTVTSPRPIFTLTRPLLPGPQTLVWTPPDNLRPRTYLLRLTLVDRAGNSRLYGAETAFVSRYARGPVVRVRGVDAGFLRPSYAPGQVAALRIATDTPELTLQTFKSGPEQFVTYADDQMHGVAVDEPRTIDWSGHTDKPRTIYFRIGAWSSGLYFVRLDAPDGRVGYAPFVVRPARLGSSSRIAVVLPTNSWQAYNFWDEDGNGYGDTWYAGAPNYTVDLSRPYNNRGVPPRFYRYDLPFLHWLFWGDHVVEFIADTDFAQIRDGDRLAKAYDLVVFEGHTEYVTQHTFDVVERYRDLGGNLMFLSANNFFWRVTQTGKKLRKVVQFRQAARPEARLLGVQYRANDDGQKQGLYVVRSEKTAPWLWAGTGLTDGSTFGQAVGGYGIEIDATTSESPPGTLVLADIPDLYGPGLTAQMTYYETPAGAKVFAAGTLDFGGSATYQPMRRLLDNLWTRLSAP